MLLELPAEAILLALRPLLLHGSIIWFNQRYEPDYLATHLKLQIQCLRVCKLLHTLGEAILYGENEYGLNISASYYPIESYLPRPLFRFIPAGLRTFHFRILNWQDQPYCICQRPNGTYRCEHTESAPQRDAQSHFLPLEEAFEYASRADTDFERVFIDQSRSIARLALDIVECRIPKVHIACPHIFFFLLEPLHYLQNLLLPTVDPDQESKYRVNITYSEAPDAYVEFLEAGRNASHLSRRHEEYRKLHVIHASGCVCNDSNLGEGLRALQSTDAETQLNGWVTLANHPYESCSQEPFPQWQLTLWEDLWDLWKEKEKDKLEDGQRGRQQIERHFDATIRSTLDEMDADAAAKQSLLQNVRDLVRANRPDSSLRDS